MTGSGGCAARDLMAPCGPMPDRNFYIHSTMDRIAERRGEPGFLERHLAHGKTRLLPVWRSKNLITGPREAPQPSMPAASEGWWRDLASEVVFLGLIDGTAYLAVDVSDVDDPQDNGDLSAAGTFVDLRTTGPLMPQETGALLAYARGVLWWHQRHRFCGVCGHPTQTIEAGHQRHLYERELRHPALPAHRSGGHRPGPRWRPLPIGPAIDLAAGHAFGAGRVRGAR